MSCDGAPVNSLCYTAPEVHDMPQFSPLGVFPLQMASATTQSAKPSEPRFLNQVAAKKRLLHYSKRTESVHRLDDPVHLVPQ